MALDITGILTKLDAVVGEAVSVADLIEKYSTTIAEIADLIPGAGPEVAKLLPILETVDKGLHDLQNALSSL